ncbi:hypothetical protein N9N67_05585 [Bacteriovoracaceae bacterium]|nr:hypothetical protein [Bacteriovoracaceae bacterium]
MLKSLCKTPLYAFLNEGGHVSLSDENFQGCSMGYLLRLLNCLMLGIVVLTILAALGYVNLEFNHVQLALPTIILTIFIQAFIMFYFIGVSRLTQKVQHSFHEEIQDQENQEIPDDDKTFYEKKLIHFVHVSTVSKRQVIPWVMIILTLGIIGLFLGAAHDTGMVAKTTHSGVVLGFFAALIIGFVKQWIYLKKAHLLLREIKSLFSIPDQSM